MNSVFGLDGCMAMQWTQCPTSAVGSGSSYLDTSPLLSAFQLLPPSSVRNAPPAEMAMNMRPGLARSSRMVWSPMPPAPGCHRSPLTVRSAANSDHDFPPSVVLNIAASSTPANTVSGSSSDGSSRHTRLNSHGCCVPSYHLCVPGTPSYVN